MLPVSVPRGMAARWPGSRSRIRLRRICNADRHFGERIQHHDSLSAVAQHDSDFGPSGVEAGSNVAAKSTAEAATTKAPNIPRTRMYLRDFNGSIAIICEFSMWIGQITDANLCSAAKQLHFTKKNLKRA
ncbi:MAG: hypothetical protein ABSF50_07595 [Burkholderiaceae bacterium]|jgi:hypothetical protein